MLNQELFESTSVIKATTMKNMDNFPTRFPLHRGSYQVLPPSHRFSLSTKMNGTQTRILTEFSTD